MRTAAATSVTSSALCARTSTLEYVSASAPYLRLMRWIAASGIETPARVARSEKPTSCIDVSCGFASVRAVTKLRPSSSGIWKPISIDSVRRGRLRWGAKTLL